MRRLQVSKYFFHLNISRSNKQKAGSIKARQKFTRAQQNENCKKFSHLWLIGGPWGHLDTRSPKENYGIEDFHRIKEFRSECTSPSRPRKSFGSSRQARRRNCCIHQLQCSINLQYMASKPRSTELWSTSLVIMPKHVCR